MADRSEGDGALATGVEQRYRGNLLSVVTAAERTPRLAAIVLASLSRSIISVLAVRRMTVQKTVYH
jgi:hypothetical protein